MWFNQWLQKFNLLIVNKSKNEQIMRKPSTSKIFDISLKFALRNKLSLLVFLVLFAYFVSKLNLSKLDWSSSLGVLCCQLPDPFSQNLKSPKCVSFQPQECLSWLKLCLSNQLPLAQSSHLWKLLKFTDITQKSLKWSHSWKNTRLIWMRAAQWV